MPTATTMSVGTRKYLKENLNLAFLYSRDIETLERERERERA